VAFEKRLKCDFTLEKLILDSIKIKLFLNRDNNDQRTVKFANDFLKKGAFGISEACLAVF